MFNNVTKVVSNNFNLVWRLMFYKMITFLICLGLFLGTVVPIISPVLDALNKNEASKDFLPALGAVISQVLSGNYFAAEFTSVYLARLNDSLGAVGTVLASNALSMFFAYLVSIFIILILRFLFNFTDYAAAFSLNENMSSNARLGFAATVAKTLKSAFRYWMAYTLVTLFYDIFLIAILVAMLYYLLSVFGALTMFFVILTAAVLIALRMTLFSLWLPEKIVNGGSSFQALRQSIKLTFKNFWANFGGYIILVMCIMVLGILIISNTFGAGLIILLPLNSLLVISYTFVSYYSSTRRSYYINYDTIAYPPADLDAEVRNITIPEEEIQARMEELKKEREEIEKE